MEKHCLAYQSLGTQTAKQPCLCGDFTSACNYGSCLLRQWTWLVSTYSQFEGFGRDPEFC